VCQTVTLAPSGYVGSTPSEPIMENLIPIIICGVIFAGRYYAEKFVCKTLGICSFRSVRNVSSKKMPHDAA
jgi:hypothetical protein